MRKLIASLVLLAVLTFVPTIKSRTKPSQDFSDVDLSNSLSVSANVGDVLDNQFVGASIGANIPFKKRYEFAFGAEIDPIEGHVALGHGFAYSGSVGAGVWFTKNIGVGVSYSPSAYHVTQAYKGDEYLTTGLNLRGQVWGQASRFGLSYIREVDNHIYGGTETSHLQGGEFGLDTRFGFAGPVAIHVFEKFTVAHVLTQGNPQCDGTYGNGSAFGEAPCPRRGAFGGGVSGGISFVFGEDKTKRLF